MNQYRTHLCSQLSINNLNEEVTLSGWVDTKRDHGNFLFIDFRDYYGLTQCVVDSSHEEFDKISSINNESVVKIIGKVIKRSKDTINKKLNTGEIEVKIFIDCILNDSPVDESNSKDAYQVMKLIYQCYQDSDYSIYQSQVS